MAKPTLYFYVLPRKAPGAAVTKWYAQKVRYSNIGTEELLERIVENTSVPRGVIRAAVDAITDSIANFLVNGHSVQLGGLMSLRPTLQNKLQEPAEGQETPSQLAGNARLRIRAYWGNDVRKFQDPKYYNFVHQNKATEP